MIVVDLPNTWDELAAAYMAQAMALKVADDVVDAAVEYLLVVDSFGKIESGAEYFDKYNQTSERLRRALADYRANIKPRAAPRCEFKFNDPDPPPTSGEACGLGHENPNMREAGAAMGELLDVARQSVSDADMCICGHSTNEHGLPRGCLVDDCRCEQFRLESGE